MGPCELKVKAELCCGFSPTSPAGRRVCVCVCVCVRERERETEIVAMLLVYASEKANAYYVHSYAYILGGKVC